jgi:polysaccharide export outer membrane protein
MWAARLRAAALYLSAGTLLCAFALVSSSHSQTVETSQQANERLKSLAASAQHAPPPTDYVIGTGDVVSVQVFDVPEMSRDLRVGQTGTIGIPLIPVRLHVSGLTEIQAERKIEEVLEANGLISHPEVSVVAKEKRSKPITVVGAVGHPMVYSAERQVTLVEVLAEAGGISADASDHVIISRPDRQPSDPTDAPAIGPEDAAPPRGQDVTPPADASSLSRTSPGPSAASPTSSPDPAPQQAPVTSAGFDSASTATGSQGPQAEPPALAPSNPTNTITINLSQILETGDMSANIVVLPGDVVTVPHAGIVYVLGAVQRPGGYTVSNDRAQLSTLKVLSLAGGLNNVAKSSHAVIVRKDITGKQTQVEVDLHKVMKFQSEDVQLRPSDILYIPTSGARTAAVRAAELGIAVGTGVLLYRVAYH